MLAFSEIQLFKPRLASFWSPSEELCGVITPEGEILQLENRAQDIQNNFEFSEEDLEGRVATWHCHPVTTANLSIEDYYFFKSWPNMAHFIIAKDEVRCFMVKDSEVYFVDQAEDHPSWTPEGEVSSPD